MKYIYFEIHSVEGGFSPEEPHMQNENILFLKPKTNSGGYWGYKNITILNNTNYTPRICSIVEQNWIDLTKYKPKETYDKLDKQVQECLDKINIKLREEKLNRILDDHM